MNRKRCPECDQELPEDAHYCTNCGNSQLPLEQETVYFHNSEEPEHEEIIPLEKKRIITAKLLDDATELNEHGDTLVPYEQGDEQEDGEVIGVSHQRGYGSAGREAGRANYRATNNVLEKERPLTWHKEVEHPPVRPPTTSIPPRPTPVTEVIFKKKRKKRKIASLSNLSNFNGNLTVWSSLIIVIVLILSGIFGIIITLGRSPNSTAQNVNPMLQVTPEIATIGDAITLQGSHFTGGGKVGLFRDSAIALIDTSGLTATHADAHGYFTDTIVVDGNWGDGSHTISAEDAQTHKRVTYPIMINAKGISLRPPHLRLSSDLLDMGSGDPMTTDTRTLTLINTGGGQITWQSSSDQSWLQLSPNSGTFSAGSDMQITIVADRSKLKVGKYTATILFTSSAGIIKLPVTMQVVPLQPVQGPVLQIAPSLLNFTVVDGSSPPPAQILTLNNQGADPIHYTSETNAPWLTISAPFATVDPSGSKTLAIGIDNSTLLPGTYQASLIFNLSAVATHQSGAQVIYVSVTVTPQCSLQVSPTILSFTANSLQTGTISKPISVNVASNCSAPVNWSISSSDAWLTASATHGRTPANPSVQVNPSGLNLGTYHGSLTISTGQTSQTVAVTLTISAAATPSVSTAPSNLVFTGVIGQTSPAPQSITLTNTGGAAMSWNAVATTAVGGSWLSLQPGSGTLAAGQSVILSVSSTLLTGLTPGSYTGSVSINGVDSNGNIAAGSPQMIPVTFTVTTPCAITATPNSVSFNAVAGQAQNPPTQNAAIVLNGNCLNPVIWSASVATQPAGGTWLSISAAAGKATGATGSTLGITVTPGTLAAGNYVGTITVTAIDSVTQAPIGTTQVITVNFAIQAPCNLITSVSALNFAAITGSSPAAQTFKGSVSSGCTGTITLAPAVTMDSGTGWLAVSPAKAAVSVISSAPFKVTINASALVAGTYTGSISLAASNGGTALANSPQVVNITLTVTDPATLTASPTSISANVTTGKSTQAIAISNGGGASLNWGVMLAASTPNWISLSQPGGNLPGGTGTTVTVGMDVTGVPGGKSYSTTLTLTATDPVSGNPTAGSPIVIPITVNVAAPAMQVSTNVVNYSATEGGADPVAQSIVLTDSGGDTLNWSIGKPSQPWLVATPAGGSDSSQASSSLSLPVSITGLSPGNYSATVLLTPSSGSPITITVNLLVNPGATPTPSPQPTSTATPPQPTATPRPIPTQPEPTPTPEPSPTSVVSQPAHHKKAGH